MRFEKKVEQLRIQKHQGKETQDFLHDVITMAEGEPLEYILGESLFCNVKIDLTLRPMIPRPETEHWVKEAIEEMKVREMAKPFRTLDLFSGSGAIGLAILKNIPDSLVDMIEYDETLKQQIELSLKKNAIDTNRAHIMTGDVWHGAHGLYSVITAVPPYVPKSMFDEVMKELHAEKPLYFFDKEDGYYYHKQVLSRVKEFLSHKGYLYLEFDITQKEQIEMLIKKYNLICIKFLQDPYGHDFVAVITF